MASPPAAAAGWRGAGRPHARAHAPQSVGPALRRCPDCDVLQAAAPPPRGVVLACVGCGHGLERTTGRDPRAALACASATSLVLVPAASFPLMRTWLLGASRESGLASGATAMLGAGAPEVAAAVALFGLALPFVRYGLLTLVLSTLQTGTRPAWLGPMFRRAQALAPWAMSEVYLLAFLIAYLRLRASVVVEIGLGGACFIAAGVLALFTRAALDEPQVWRAIAPDTPAPAGTTDVLACTGCGLSVPQRRRGGAAPAAPPCCGAADRKRRCAPWR